MSTPVRGGRRSALLMLAVVGCALFAAVFLLTARERDNESLEPLLERGTQAGAPGVLLPVRDGSAIRSTVRGVADRDRARPVQAGDRFRIGSVTKTFVATVALQLMDEGRIRLDDSVEAWLPDLVPRGPSITVRHLLSHTSGLFDYVDDPRVFAPYAREPAYAWDPRRLIEIAVSHPPQFPPGRQFAYSSTNYLLIGLIVEAATGTPLDEELRKRIFEPVGLDQTTFAPRFVSGPFVHGHRAPSHQGVITGPPVDISQGCHLDVGGRRDCLERRRSPPLRSAARG